jgi:hypothetical protein
MTQNPLKSVDQSDSASNYEESHLEFQPHLQLVRVFPSRGSNFCNIYLSSHAVTAVQVRPGLSRLKDENPAHGPNEIPNTKGNLRVSLSARKLPLFSVFKKLVPPLAGVAHVDAACCMHVRVKYRYQYQALCQALAKRVKVSETTYEKQGLGCDWWILLKSGWSFPTFGSTDLRN